MLTLTPSADTDLTLIANYQHDPSGGGYSGVPAYGSVLPNPLGALPEDINTGDPGYEVFNRYQRSLSALFRHAFNEQVTVRANVRFQNTDLRYRQIYVADSRPPAREPIAIPISRRSHAVAAELTKTSIR